MTGTTVESVDIKSKTLKLASGGEDITYDKLIIATGSTVSPVAFVLFLISPNSYSQPFVKSERQMRDAQGCHYLLTSQQPN